MSDASPSTQMRLAAAGRDKRSLVSHRDVAARRDRAGRAAVRRDCRERCRRPNPSWPNSAPFWRLRSDSAVSVVRVLCPRAAAPDALRRGRRRAWLLCAFAPAAFASKASPATSCLELRFRWLAACRPDLPQASGRPAADATSTCSKPRRRLSRSFWARPTRRWTTSDLARDWSAQPPKLLWRQPIGAGLVQLSPWWAILRSRKSSAARRN